MRIEYRLDAFHEGDCRCVQVDADEFLAFVADAVLTRDPAAEGIRQAIQFFQDAMESLIPVCLAPREGLDDRRMEVAVTRVPVTRDFHLLVSRESEESFHE